MVTIHMSSSSSSLTSKQKAEITNLKATLAYINENLSIEEINQILFESLDDHNHLDKNRAIELAFAKKVKEETTEQEIKLLKVEEKKNE
jgi:hypothetical protein